MPGRGLHRRWRMLLAALVFVGLAAPAGAADRVASGPPARLAPASDEALSGDIPADLLRALPLPASAAPRRRRMASAGRGDHVGPARPAATGPDVRLEAPSPLHAPLDSAVRLDFSQAMDVESVQGAFRIDPAVQGTFEWPDQRTLVFRPAAPLAYRTTYRVGVAGYGLGAGRLAAAGTFTFATVWPPPAVPYPFTLTFDDCGTADAIQAILSALADRGLQAIFFPTGKCRDQFPWLVPTLLASGHRVCNHTYSHPDLSKLPIDAIRSEIQRGVAVGCDLFRPPYGAMDKTGRVAAAAASLHYRIQLWDVDTRDWSGTPADVMVSMIRARGGVVLMHMHGKHTVEAIRAL